MKKLTVLTLLCLMFASAALGQARTIDIIPVPLSVEMNDGTFRMGSETMIVIPKRYKDLVKVAEMTNEYLGKLTDQELEIKKGKARDNAINLVLDKKNMEAEQYELIITDKRITVKGGSPAGVFYGIQTLRQMVVANAQGLPAVTIKDKPSFGYRGGHFDVSRHFFSVDDVKKYIDILAMHKMNRFHWHLTDDQGWRIEIKSHPLLTQVGSMRDGTLIGHGGNPPFVFDGKPYGGYYTQEEVKEIVKYAADRYITVIPEIEMPGHALAALAAYPELGCTGGPYNVIGRWGVFDDVFCAGNDQVFELLEDVLAEVIELFPSKLIHIGGDECPKKRWEVCPKCQARIKENNLRDEHHLQSWFIQRIEKWMIKQGRNIIGWDEILEGGLSKTATVMSWRGTDGGIAAAKAGNNVVMSPNTYAYLDYYQSADRSMEPFAISGFLPLEKTYQLDPYAGLDQSQYKYILGVQGNLWTEYIGSFAHAEYMLLPRLTAIAETGWSYGRKDFESFVSRLNTMRKLYDVYGINYAKHIFEGGGRLK